MIKTETSEQYLQRMRAKRIVSLDRSRAAEAWMSEDKERALDGFLSIPTAELSPATLEAGLALSQHLFHQHGVKPSLDYAESVLRLSQACCLALPWIHGAFITDAMVEAYLINAMNDAQYANNTHIMPYQMFIKKPGFVPGSSFVNGYISEGISNHNYIPTKYLPLVTDETLKKAILKEPDRVGNLFHKSLNRSHILIAMVMEGYERPVLPLTLRAAQENHHPVPALLDYLIANASKDRYIEWACCIGMIKRHSLAEIMHIKLTVEQTLALRHVYSGEDLMPYVKIQPLLKGPLLEEFLGL